jgi:hypothetical protein
MMVMFVSKKEAVERFTATKTRQKLMASKPRHVITRASRQGFRGTGLMDRAGSGSTPEPPGPPTRSTEFGKAGALAKDGGWWNNSAQSLTSGRHSVS